MSEIHEEALSYNLHGVFNNAYACVYTNTQQSLLLCQTRSTYISIESFKAIFLSCSDFIKDQPVEKFIFDKRSLRAFHQPSMEWYFVHWKQTIYHEHGLRTHRKILPSMEWFQKCVEAGKAEIEQKHPHNIFAQLDIRYTSSIEEALQV